MKKFFILICVLCNTYAANSQTYTFSGHSASLCYELGNISCYTSHGSPGLYDNYNVLLFASKANKTEGIFIDYPFNENRKYRIIITLKKELGSPGIEVYAANGFLISFFIGEMPDSIVF